MVGLPGNGGGTGLPVWGSEVPIIGNSLPQTGSEFPVSWFVLRAEGVVISPQNWSSGRGRSDKWRRRGGAEKGGWSCRRRNRGPTNFSYRQKAFSCFYDAIADWAVWRVICCLTARPCWWPSPFWMNAMARRRRARSSILISRVMGAGFIAMWGRRRRSQRQSAGLGKASGRPAWFIQRRRCGGCFWRRWRIWKAWRMTNCCVVWAGGRALMAVCERQGWRTDRFVSSAVRICPSCPPFIIPNIRARMPLVEDARGIHLRLA